MLSIPSRQLLSGTRVQLPMTQLKFVWQSDGCVHDVRHPDDRHAYPLGHEPPAPALQVPAPSQVPLQDAPQIVVAGGYVQSADAPSQVPAHRPLD